MQKERPARPHPGDRRERRRGDVGHVLRLIRSVEHRRRGATLTACWLSVRVADHVGRPGRDRQAHQDDRPAR
jgi:hypothetical protein